MKNGNVIKLQATTCVYTKPFKPFSQSVLSCADELANDGTALSANQPIRAEIVTATTGFGERPGWMAAARTKVSIFSGEPSSTYVEFQIEVGGNNI